MHPSVDKAKSAPTPMKSPSIEINYACTPARSLLKESTMRITIKALLCSVLATACAPIGEPGGDYDAPDAGVDAGSASATCDSIETRTLDMTVSGTSEFTNLPKKCWRLAGKLTVNGSALTSIAQLGDLREVEDLVIEGTTQLTKIDTTNPFVVIGSVTITNNSKLSDIAKVETKPTITGLTVQNNAELINLGGLTKATTITGLTKIANNPKLATINLGTAQRLEGGLTVSDNLVLATIDLHSVTSVGAVEVRNNGALTGLQLTALQHVHGNLTIDNNDKLTTLASIANGINVSAPYAVWITNNNALTNIQSIARATFIYGVLTISGNTQLPQTAAHEAYCCTDAWDVVYANTTGSCQGGHYCAQCIRN